MNVNAQYTRVHQRLALKHNGVSIPISLAYIVFWDMCMHVASHLYVIATWYSCKYVMWQSCVSLSEVGNIS